MNGEGARMTQRRTSFSRRGKNLENVKRRRRFKEYLDCIIKQSEDCTFAQSRRGWIYEFLRQPQAPRKQFKRTTTSFYFPLNVSIYTKHQIFTLIFPEKSRAGGLESSESLMNFQFPLPSLDTFSRSHQYAEGRGRAFIFRSGREKFVSLCCFPAFFFDLVGKQRVECRDPLRPTIRSSTCLSAFAFHVWCDIDIALLRRTKVRWSIGSWMKGKCEKLN